MIRFKISAIYARRRKPRSVTVRGLSGRFRRKTDAFCGGFRFAGDGEAVYNRIAQRGARHGRRTDVKTNVDLAGYLPSEIKRLKIIGRTNRETDPVTLFWTGSGIELCVKGSELWAEFVSGYDSLEPWVSVFIDGAFVSRMMLPAGRQTVCIFRGMRADVPRTVRILRDSQAMPGDDDCFVQISRLLFDGEFLDLAPRRYRVEFIGDSITSGEGLIGAVGDSQWLPMYHSVAGNYALLTADALNADFSILSQGGYGVLAGWDNDPRSAMPLYYEQICGVLHGEHNRALGAFGPYDFAHWQPDAVVINLGTNDSNAFRHEAWTDPETGGTYQLKPGPDGGYDPEDTGKFQLAVAAFLETLRRRNPHAYLVWAYGMLDTPLWGPLAAAVNGYASGNGDERIKAVRLPCVTKNGYGANGHPGRPCHKAAAETLTKTLSELLAGPAAPQEAE